MPICPQAVSILSHKSSKPPGRYMKPTPLDPCKPSLSDYSGLVQVAFRSDLRLQWLAVVLTAASLFISIRRYGCLSCHHKDAFRSTFASAVALMAMQSSHAGV